MLPAEWRKNHVAEPGKGLPPAVTMTPQPKSLRMERGHGKLDFRPLAGVSCSLRGNGVVRHRAGILAADRTWQVRDRMLTLTGDKPMIRRGVPTERLYEL